MFQKREKTLPARSKLIAWAEMIQVTQIGNTRLAEIVELGWIEPVKTVEDEYLFRLEDVYRMKKLDRICNDLGVNTLGGTIIVDLLERVERLEKQVEEFKRLL